MTNSDNPIQINITFTFAVHEYIIVYKYIWKYSIIQFDIYIYIYIYTLYIDTIYIIDPIDIVAIHTYDGHTGFTFAWSFPAAFNSRNGLHSCEHDPSY